MSTESRGTRGLFGKLFGKGTVAALLIAVLLISGTAWAQQYTVSGVGAESCGSWTAAKEAGYNNMDRTIFWEWANGYLTAYSRWVEEGSGPVTATRSRGAWAWIDNYCQENPLEGVAKAAEQLIFAIEAK